MRGLAWLAVAVVATGARIGAASPLDPQPVGARAVGRSGAVVASAAGVAALAVNPAGLTHADDVVVEVGLGLSGLHLGFQRVGATNLIYPHAESHAAAEALPLVGVSASLLGGRLALGAAYYVAGRYAVDYPASTATSRPAIVDPQRYMVGHFAASRQALAAGVALRPLPWLSFGAAFLAYRLTISLQRDAWIGVDADHPQSEDPRLDMPFGLTLEDQLVPALGAGIGIRPPHTPLELGASLEVSADAAMSGTATPGQPIMLPAGFTTWALGGSRRVTASLPMPLVLRAGARLRGRRLDLETAAEVSLLGSGSPGEWRAHGGVTATLGRMADDPAPLVATFDPIPLGVVTRTQFAWRAGGDLVLVPGFLTARGGYSYLSAASDSPLASAIETGAATHVVALGLAAEGAGLRLEAGYSHGFQGERRVPDSAWRHWNPIGGASAQIGAGRYSSSTDLVTISLTVALGAARKAFFPPPEPPEPADVSAETSTPPEGEPEAAQPAVAQPASAP